MGRRKDLGTPFPTTSSTMPQEVLLNPLNMIISQRGEKKLLRTKEPVVIGKKDLFFQNIKRIGNLIQLDVHLAPLGKILYFQINPNSEENGDKIFTRLNLFNECFPKFPSKSSNFIALAERVIHLCDIYEEKGLTPWHIDEILTLLDLPKNKKNKITYFATSKNPFWKFLNYDKNNKTYSLKKSFDGLYEQAQQGNEDAVEVDPVEIAALALSQKQEELEANEEALKAAEAALAAAEKRLKLLPMFYGVLKQLKPESTPAEAQKILASVGS